MIAFVELAKEGAPDWAEMNVDGSLDNGSFGWLVHLVHIETGKINNER